MPQLLSVPPRKASATALMLEDEKLWPSCLSSRTAHHHSICDLLLHWVLVGVSW